MDCQACRNAILLEIVHIRRSSQKILAAHGSQEPGHVTPAVLNINHSLNAMEAKIEECRNAEIRPDKCLTLDNM